MERKSLDEIVLEIIGSASSVGFKHFGLCIGERKSEVGDHIPDDEEWGGTLALKVGFDPYTGGVLNLEGGIKELIPRLAPGERIMLVGGRNSFKGSVSWEIAIMEAEVLHVISDKHIKEAISVEISIIPGSTIITEEIGAVNRLSSKIRAISERGSVTIDCDPQSDIVDNHERAARRLAEERFLHLVNGLWIGGETKKGYVFLNVDKYALRALLDELPE